MPLSAPFAEGAVLAAPLLVAGDPCACVCVVWAGEFCEENLELMLLIHEFRRELALESGGVVPLPIFSVLPRLSSVGRFAGIFWEGVGAVEGVGRGGGASCWAGGAGSGTWCSSGRCLMGSPPCDDVLGAASLARPGDDGACWRW